MIELGGDALGGVALGQDGSLDDKVEPIPRGEAAEPAPFPIEGADVLEIGHTDIPWGEVPVKDAGTDFLADESVADGGPLEEVGVARRGIQHLPLLEVLNQLRWGVVEPVVEQALDADVIIEAAAGESQGSCEIVYLVLGAKNTLVRDAVDEEHYRPSNVSKGRAASTAILL